MFDENEKKFWNWGIQTVRSSQFSYERIPGPALIALRKTTTDRDVRWKTKSVRDSLSSFASNFPDVETGDWDGLRKRESLPQSLFTLQYH